jgi:hypothetical protein
MTSRRRAAPAEDMQEPIRLRREGDEMEEQDTPKEQPPMAAPRSVTSFKSFCMSRKLGDLSAAMQILVNNDMRERTMEEWAALYERLRTL